MEEVYRFDSTGIMARSKQDQYLHEAQLHRQRLYVMAQIKITDNQSTNSRLEPVFCCWEAAITYPSI